MLACRETDRAKYCKDTDISNLKDLSSRPNVTQNLDPLAKEIPGVTQTAVRKDAYQKVGQIDVEVWGISFPISEDIKDAYIAFSNDSYVVRLRSLDGDKCFNGGGVATLRRTRISDIKFQESISTSGKVIGDTVYGLYGNSYLSLCAKKGSMSAERKNLIVDIFHWSEANIQ